MFRCARHLSICIGLFVAVAVQPHIAQAQGASATDSAAITRSDTARTPTANKQVTLPRPDVRGTAGIFMNGKNTVTDHGRRYSLFGNAAPPNKNQSMALMVVGGAAFLGGLIIDNDAGTVIAIGGLIAGLYGLYNYLQ